MYEQSESLSPTAEKLGLTIQRADNVQRIPGPNAVAPLNNERFLEALFSAQHRATSAIPMPVEFGSTSWCLDASLPIPRPNDWALDEVRDQVRAQYIAQEAAKLAKTGCD